MGDLKATTAEFVVRVDRIEMSIDIGTGVVTIAMTLEQARAFQKRLQWAIDALASAGGGAGGGDV